MGVKRGLGQQSRLKSFENSVLRKIFGTKCDVVIGDWKEVYKQKRQEIYSSLNFNQVIESRKKEMRGVRNTCGEKGGACRIWCGNLMDSDHLDKVGVEGPLRRYLYFDVVEGLAWSHEPKSYAGGSFCYWPPMPNRSRVMTQTKRDNLVLQFGGWAWG